MGNTDSVFTTVHMWKVGAPTPNTDLSVPQLTNQISLRFPGSSTDTVGRFQNAEVYIRICNIIGVEPGQGELIHICEYLFQHSRSNYVLKRQEKRVKDQLVATLEAHRYELLPLLTDARTPDELRQIYVMSLRESQERRQHLKDVRRERHKKQKLVKAWSVESLLNRPSC